MEKYKLTGETRMLRGHTLHRVRALKDFGSIKAGDLGGWVESESNLSQDGNCWVSSDAVVCGSANVYGDAQVCGNAEVFGNAIVCGDARVFGNAEVFGNAIVYDNANVYDDAQVYGDANVYDGAWVYDDAEVSGGAKIYGNAVVCGDAQVYGKALISGMAWVCGDAIVCGDARVFGGAWIFGNAVVKSCRDYALIRNFWSSGRWITYTRSNRMWTVGCFRGTGEELVKKAYADSEEKGKCYEAFVETVEKVYGILEKRN